MVSNGLNLMNVHKNHSDEKIALWGTAAKRKGFYNFTLENGYYPLCLSVNRLFTDTNNVL
jgi:hypothetical protein